MAVVVLRRAAHTDAVLAIHGIEIRMAEINAGVEYGYAGRARLVYFRIRARAGARVDPAYSGRGRIAGSERNHARRLHLAVLGHEEHAGVAAHRRQALAGDGCRIPLQGVLVDVAGGEAVPLGMLGCYRPG